MLWLLLILLIFFSLVLIRSSDRLVDAMRDLVVATHADAYGLSSFLLALSTSLPELSVAISAGIQQEANLALGNVLGSNIANVSLVLGGGALLAGKLKATDSFLKRDMFLVFLAGGLPLLMLIDRRLDWWEGLVLILVYVVYNLTILKPERRQMASKEVHELSWWHRILVRVRHEEVERGVGHLVMAAALLIFSADMMVRLATQVAVTLNLSLVIVGLFLVAIGTSLPELVLEIGAIRRGEVQMALGNILGSIVANSTLILGVTVLISPIVLTNGMESYLIASGVFVGLFLLFWGLIFTKHLLERWEGALLLLMYFLFMGFEWWRVG